MKQKTLKILFLLGLFLLANFILLLIDNPFFVTVSIMGIYFLGLAFNFWNKRDNLFFVVGVMVGTFVELLGTFNGRWSYIEQHFFYIPMWLPFAWGYLVAVVSKMMLTMVE